MILSETTSQSPQQTTSQSPQQITSQAPQQTTSPQTTSQQTTSQAPQQTTSQQTTSPQTTVVKDILYISNEITNGINDAMVEILNLKVPIQSDGTFENISMEFRSTIDTFFINSNLALQRKDMTQSIPLYIPDRVGAFLIAYYNTVAGLSLDSNTRIVNISAFSSSTTLNRSTNWGISVAAISNHVNTYWSMPLNKGDSGTFYDLFNSPIGYYSRPSEGSDVNSIIIRNIKNKSTTIHAGDDCIIGKNIYNLLAINSNPLFTFIKSNDSDISSTTYDINIVIYSLLIIIIISFLIYVFI